MSTTFMVKSSLVFLVCHINLVLMTILFLFNMSKSTTQHYILSIIQVMLYVLGVIFNIYVVLHASRKWELVVRYFQNSRIYLRMMRNEIKDNIVNSIEVSIDHISAVVTFIMERFRHLNCDYSSDISAKLLEEIEPLGTNEQIPKSPARQILEDVVGRVEIATVFQKEIIPNMQVTSEEKTTPEPMKMYNLRPVPRPKSDPVKRTVKTEVIKSQSPELLKNKIFKSRMNLICDSPCSRLDKRNK